MVYGPYYTHSVSLSDTKNYAQTIQIETVFDSRSSP